MSPRHEYWVRDMGFVGNCPEWAKRRLWRITAWELAAWNAVGQDPRLAVFDYMPGQIRFYDWHVILTSR